MEKIKKKLCGALIQATILGDIRCANEKPCPTHNQCTCGFSKDTADEIGHYKGCPREGDKTWWQRKGSKKEPRSECCDAKIVTIDGIETCVFKCSECDRTLNFNEAQKMIRYCYEKSQRKKK